MAEYEIEVSAFHKRTIVVEAEDAHTAKQVGILLFDMDTSIAAEHGFEFDTRVVTGVTAR